MSLVALARARQGTSTKSLAADLLATQCSHVGLPLPMREWEFHPFRKWRFDCAWVQHWLALEIDGGAFVGGRHTTGKGFRDDCEKLNEAACLGWRVIRVLPEQVKSGQALGWIERILNNSAVARGSSR